LLEALRQPLDREELIRLVPELGLSRSLRQSEYHHLDALDHVLDTVRLVRRELEEGELGAEVRRPAGLLLAALLHDIAKPVTRGELDGRVLFVAHDTLGARLAARICARVGADAETADLVATLTELHLKIGFLNHRFTDYPAPRLARAAGPFGEELAVLCWADRLAAQGPKLKPEHLSRHRELCAGFLRASRELGPYPLPDYGELAGRLGLGRTEAGFVASRIRLLEARGLKRREAVGLASGLYRYLRGTRTAVE
jgi:poly(A) polymerase